jgi:hypothetical protein
VFHPALKQPIEIDAAPKRRIGMTHERESPGRKAVATEHNIELIREAQTTPSTVANGENSVESPYSTKQTDLGAGTQTELHSLRDALWEAINGIEEKAPGAPIEREMTILDRVADLLGNMMCKAESESGLQ